MPGQVLHKVPLFGWAIFITAILLLLALPVLAGIIIIILPALYSAICWEIFYNFERQSAENLEHLNVRRILRDYTPESIYYEIIFIIYSLYFNIIFLNYDNLSKFDLENNIEHKDKRYFFIKNNYDFSNINSSFCSYLAGLIEGDGTIIVPKTERSKIGGLNYPSVQICFDLRDMPLAMIIQK